MKKLVYFIKCLPVLIPLFAYAIILGTPFLIIGGIVDLTMSILRFIADKCEHLADLNDKIQATLLKPMKKYGFTALDHWAKWVGVEE